MASLGSFKAVMSKKLKVSFQTPCLRTAYWVCCHYESWVISFTGICSVPFKIQGSRDDLSTAGGFQSQAAMKHANSVDTSFSKDVLNSIAGINDRWNTHTSRFLCISIHRAFCLVFMEDIINPFHTIFRETWYTMFLFPLGVFGLIFISLVKLLFFHCFTYAPALEWCQYSGSHKSLYLSSFL